MFQIRTGRYAPALLDWLALSPGLAVLFPKAESPDVLLALAAEDEHPAFLKEHRDEYSSLDATFREWTDAEAQVGVYKLLAEATVRPRTGRGRAGRRPKGRKRGPR